jgi:hypothetical protein
MFPKLWMLCASLTGRRRTIPAPPTMFAALRYGLCTLALIAFDPCDASAGKLHEPEIDSEHLFGFTIGSDIGERGEKEIENEANARTGKNGGSYTAIFEQLEAKYTVAQNFRIAATAVFVYHDISGVPDIEDLRRGAFQGTSVDARFRFLDREQSPFGFTVSIEPHWNRIDDITGERVQNSGGTVTVALDKEVVARRLYAAINVLYQPEVTHFLDPDTWVRQSTLGISGALAVQVRSGVFVGGEVVYRHLYDGLRFESFAGRALFLGPTFYARLSEHWWASLAWNIQVAGHAADQPGALDLVNFERHRALLRLGYHF